MKKGILIISSITLLACQLTGQIKPKDIFSNNPLGNSTSGTGLTSEEVIRGLKEALNVGTKASTEQASKVDGYYKNPLTFIPFPPQAQKIKSTVESLGMKQQVENFVKSMNRAAEEAAKDAAPIFLNAITSMTINDGMAILKGNDDAATQYLKGKTYNPLGEKLKPIIRKAMQKVQVAKYWKPLAESYNRVPFVEKINPDLEAYITEKALDGLFKLLAQEELKIRKDPGARITEILKKVFG